VACPARTGSLRDADQRTPPPHAVANAPNYRASRLYTHPTTIVGVHGAPCPARTGHNLTSRLRLTPRICNIQEHPRRTRERTSWKEKWKLHQAMLRSHCWLAPSRGGNPEHPPKTMARPPPPEKCWRAASRGRRAARPIGPDGRPLHREGWDGGPKKVTSAGRARILRLTGRVSRIDPKTGERTTFATGIPLRREINGGQGFGVVDGRLRGPTISTNLITGASTTSHRISRPSETASTHREGRFIQAGRETSAVQRRQPG